MVSGSGSRPGPPVRDVPRLPAAARPRRRRAGCRRSRRTAPRPAARPAPRPPSAPRAGPPRPGRGPRGEWRARPAGDRARRAWSRAAPGPPGRGRGTCPRPVLDCPPATTLRTAAGRATARPRHGGRPGRARAAAPRPLSSGTPPSSRRAGSARPASRPLPARPGPERARAAAERSGRRRPRTRPAAAVRRPARPRARTPAATASTASRGSPARFPAATDQDLRAAPRRPAHHLVGEPALADPWLSLEQEQLASPGESVVETARQLGQLGLAPDEAPRGFRPPFHGLRVGRGLERGILAENGLVELAQLPARLDAELVDERPSGVLVDVERLGLPTAPVEREHQQRAEPLTQRMLGGERLELRDQVWPATEREVCLDPFLENRQPPFLEAADLLPRETGVGDVGQGRATPQRECVDQLTGPPCRRGARNARRRARRVRPGSRTRAPWSRSGPGPAFS